METILNSVSGCGSLDSNYDYLSDPTLKKVKDAIRDTQKELFWLPDEKVEALVGQIVAR